MCKSPESISSTLCNKKSIIECFLDYSYDQFNILIFEFDLFHNINVYGPPQKRGFHLRHPVHSGRQEVMKIKDFHIPNDFIAYIVIN